MGDALRLKLGRWMIPVPAAIWRRRVAREGRELTRLLCFMTPEHHRVRDFVVAELPRSGRPLAPEAIATALRLPVERVVGLLDELEKRKLFLFRNPEGEVAWAYPVAVDATPHHFAFESGERLNAA